MQIPVIGTKYINLNFSFGWISRYLVLAQNNSNLTYIGLASHFSNCYVNGD